MSADAYKTIVISCHEEESSKMVYYRDPRGTIKVQALHPDDESFETEEFSLTKLQDLILSYNRKGYQLVSLFNGGRSSKNGLTLASTVVLSKKYTEIW
jgi:hypothetical protein